MASRDLESPPLPYSYSSLPSSDDQRTQAPESERRSSTHKRRALGVIATVASLVIVLNIVSGAMRSAPAAGNAAVEQQRSQMAAATSRGVTKGVSEKSTAPLLGSTPIFSWTSDMLDWQRTSFHFQPEKNWMNDPNGPLFHKGWYHLFYQYNPDSAIWGNIAWGHAVSRDLIHWLYLPLAMVPDQWYDENGVWTGSATFLHSGSIVMLYTGSTNASVQVQCLAVPADHDDPLLLNWVKSESNPVLLPPPGVGDTDFRDPTTAWYLPDESAWFVAIGSKDADHSGLALVYKTKDFYSYELLQGVLHSVAKTGMWECVDFYPVSTEEPSVGLDTSVTPGPTVKHVLKASLDDDKQDYYAIGTYYPVENKWVPDDPENDVGIGQRYDYGKFYASKTFYDNEKERRILWGWIGETDSESSDLQKGWASVQAIPRTVEYDRKTESNLLLWPVEEIESLRLSRKDFNATVIAAGSVLPVDIGRATQLDIYAEFEVDPTALVETVEADVTYSCSTSGGAADRGVLGPFGLLVLADEDLSEQTAVYFYVARASNGDLTTFFCQDEIRSSKAHDIVKRVHGSSVPVLDGETLAVRILVDHSIVESFAQHGRRVITSRVYPTNAIYSTAKVFLFNNATGASVNAKSLTIYQMENAYLRAYPL